MKSERCKICGKKLRKLNKHLLRKHRIYVEIYKKKYFPDEK